MEESKELLEFVSETKERLSDPNLLKNPFVGKFDYRENIIYMELNSIYPNLSWIGILFAVPILLFRLSLWWLIVTVPWILLWFVFSKYALYIGLRMGLRKKGYIGKIKMVRC